MSRYPYEVCVAPGCHGEPSNPVVSRHRTLRAAIVRARRSDRLQVEMAVGGRVLYLPPQRNSTTCGAGRYGAGPQRGEPSLDECVALARAAEVRADRIAQAKSHMFSGRH